MAAVEFGATAMSCAKKPTVLLTLDFVPSVQMLTQGKR